MEEIKVGEYVRTKNQGIFIISHINIDFDDSDFNKVCICQNKKIAFGSIEEIKKLKRSKNPIDLIEVGDYVNSHLVKAVYLDGATKYIKLDNAYENGEGIRTYSEDIKSIVTHEQFSNIEYRLEN